MKRMKKQIAAIILLAALTMTLSACSGGGTPPVLTVAGKEVTLGESALSVFPMTEFEIKLPNQGMPIGKMPGKSWLSSFMSLSNDDGSYAYLYVYNPDSDEVMVTSATIYGISFHMYSEDPDVSYWAQDNALVNGVDYFGMGAEGVKETMAEFKTLTESDDYMAYRDGKYTYSFHLDENGIVEEVEVEMKVNKSYTSY